MNTLHKNFLLSEDREFLTKFIGMLQKRGNKQRALTTVFGVLSLLKMGINGAPIWSDFPLHTLDEQNPLKIIHRSLYHLQPAFLLRRIIRSGRRYDLPVPISPKRATFFAIDWLRKTALKHNKNDASFHFLLASEISLALYQQGSSKDFLKSYIDIALDQRPFGRFIKKKKKAISKIKGRPTSPRLVKYNAHIRRSMKIRQYRAKSLIRKINKHNIHSSFLESGQKFTERRNRKGFIIKKKKTFKIKKVIKKKAPDKKKPIKLNKKK